MADPAMLGRVRDLLLGPDPDHAAQGVELILALGEPALFAEALQGCRILPGGSLRGSRCFPGGSDSEPFPPAHLCHLLTLLAHLPPDAPTDPSLRPENIDRLRLSVAQHLCLPTTPFPRLTHLSLTRNHLSALPATLGLVFPGITHLDLSHNALSALPLDALAPLSGLTDLDLSFNPLASLPAEIRRLSSVIALRLVGSHLSSLPDALADLSHLQILDLSRCTALRALPPAVMALPRLEVLALRSVPLRLQVEQILQMPALKRLLISRSSYPLDAAEVRASLRRLRPDLQISL